MTWIVGQPTIGTGIQVNQDYLGVRREITLTKTQYPRKQGLIIPHARSSKPELRLGWNYSGELIAFNRVGNQIAFRTFAIVEQQGFTVR